MTDPDPFDSIQLALGRTEVIITDTSPTLDFSRSGYLTGIDYDYEFAHGRLINGSHPLFSEHDVILEGAASQQAHAFFVERISYSLTAAEVAGVTEPFEVRLAGGVRDQAENPLFADFSTLTVNPIPEPSAVLGGIALLGLGALRRRR